jgi:hypothetical protein
LKLRLILKETAGRRRVEPWVGSCGFCLVLFSRRGAEALREPVVEPLFSSAPQRDYYFIAITGIDFKATHPTGIVELPVSILALFLFLPTVPLTSARC